MRKNCFANLRSDFCHSFEANSLSASKNCYNHLMIYVNHPR